MVQTVVRYIKMKDNVHVELINTKKKELQMNTYKIFQVPFESDLRRDVMFYDEDSKIYNQADAEKACTNSDYDYVGDIQATDLNEVFHKGNTGGQPRGAHSISVGDIIATEQGKYFIVAPCGFDELFAERAVA